MSNETQSTAHRGHENFLIRPIHEDDAAELIGLLRSVAEEKKYITLEIITWNEKKQKEIIKDYNGIDSLMLVAECNGKIVGMVDIRRGRYLKTHHVAEIGICILKGYRRKGIGKKLMERAIEWAKKMGVMKAEVEVFATNKAAIALYKRLGFEEEGRRKKHYKIMGEYVDGIFMGKFLMKL